MSSFDAIWTTFQNFIRRKSPYCENHINMDQNLHIEYDTEEEEEFSRSSTQSDYDNQGDPNDPGDMDSRTSTQDIQSVRSEEETIIAQYMDKSSVSSVSSPSSSSSSFPSDSASSILQSTIPPRPSYLAREFIAKSGRITLTSASSSTSSKKRESVEVFGHSPKIGLTTLTSASSITPLCIIGRGGFGEVLLVDVHDKGVDFPCVLKKMIHVGSLDLVRKCRKEFKIQRKLYEKCKNRISRPIFILNLLDKEYNGSFGFIMEYCAGGSVKEFNRRWCIKNVSFLKDSSSDLASFPHRFDPMTLDSLKVSALCVEIIECLDDVFKANPGFVHRDIKPENFLIKVDRKSSECTAVLSDHGLALIKRSVTLGNFCSDSSSSNPSQKSSKSSKNHVLCGTFGYDSFEALQGMHSQKSDAYSLGITILALFQCCNPFYDMRLLQNASSPTEFVGKLLKLLSEGIGPKLSSSYLFKTLKTIEGGKFKSVYSCLNEIFEGLTKVDIDERMSVHEACEKVQSIKPLLPKIGEGWECPSIDDIVKAQLAKYGGYRGYIVEKESESMKESGDKVSSTYLPSERQSERESKTGALKQKLKLEEEKKQREELKTDDVRKKESELKSLIMSIKRTESQRAITSLYKESSPRLKTIFDEFASSPSAITSNIDLFELCFECLSLFVKHKVTKGDVTLKEDEDDIEVILDRYSIKNIIDTFLPSMIRVENILRVKEEEEEEEEEEEGGTGEAGVNSITMLLFRIICNSTFHVESLRVSIFPQISSLLSKMFILGLSKKFEDSFIEDILTTCRNIAFAKDDPTKNSLLFLLLPHILPWMKKYPDKKFFFLWTNILKNFTLDKYNTDPHKHRSSQLWFVFHPVLDVIKDTASKGITFDDDAVIHCFRFFVNLSCIPSQAVEVHDCIKDGLLDGWFEMIKKKTEEGKDDGNWGIKHWSRLISMFSTVPSLVPHISPKYDTNMKWCKNNRGWSEDYSRYLGNSYPSLKKWSELVESINKCPDSASKYRLYHEHRDEIRSVFLAFQSKSEIKEHKREIILCAQCLQWFVRHVISGNDIYLPIPDLNDLIDTFIGHLSRCEEVLEGDVDEEYCRICVNYTFNVEDKKDSFLPNISPTFQRILERGSKEKLGGKVVPNLLITLKNISNFRSSSTRSSILTLIKPYIRDWLRIYNDSECYGRWMNILSLTTLSSDDSTPNKSMYSEAWPLFHPVLDVVKREFVGDKIVEDEHECVLFFFSNLCYDQAHAVEVYDNVKGLLDGWFTVIKKIKHKRGIKYWLHLISMFSTVPSLVPFISSKYDDNMEWCYTNCGLNDDYTRYHENRNLTLLFLKLVGKIKKGSDIESTSKLYMERRNELMSVFHAYDTNNMITDHKREIILCSQCLQWFVCHNISGNDIYLPIPDLNDLIDTFIGHLSRCEEVLEGDVDEEYCWICRGYTFKVQDKWDSFLPKISPTFQRILERGSKEKLGGDVVPNLLITLRNISFSPSSSTRSSIFTLIKPYIRDWLRIYNDSKYYGRWMNILSLTTLSSDNSTPNKSICSEAWPLFHPVLDVVKREFVGDKIVEDGHERVLCFFSNLCCDPSHTVEVYDNVKDLLDNWFTVIKKEGHKRGIKYWSKLISMFSTVPSLVPFISPKYDTNMKWCNNNGGWDDDYTRYLSNRYPYLKWSELVVTINKCPDSASKYRLYHEHRDEILSVFLAFQSKSEIEEHKREIVLCAQCLRWFVRHVISGNDIYLPIPDLNDLI
ncbi:hypothetical protein ADUPG1_014025, partial [Aduncisulcus paluster]